MIQEWSGVAGGICEWIPDFPVCLHTEAVWQPAWQYGNLPLLLTLRRFAVTCRPLSAWYVLVRHHEHDHDHDP